MECSSDINNFRCLLPKVDFRIFCFELETLLSMLVKLCSSFFEKNDFEQECSVLFSSKKSTYFLIGPLYLNCNSLLLLPSNEFG